MVSHQDMAVEGLFLCVVVSVLPSVFLVGDVALLGDVACEFRADGLRF